MNELTAERWLPVVGYEGLYEVSDVGRVKSLPRNTTRGGVMKLANDKRGAKRVMLTQNGKQRLYLVHQLVLSAYVGPCPKGLEGCHNDGNPANNVLSNLRWDTHEANVGDMIRHGTGHWQNQTHCTNGHEYTTENTKFNKKGARTCATCQAEHGRQNYQRYKAEGRVTYVPVAELSPEVLERKRMRARGAARRRRARLRAERLSAS